jgi:hypothetical protein
LIGMISSIFMMRISRVTTTPPTIFFMGSQSCTLPRKELGVFPAPRDAAAEYDIFQFHLSYLPSVC